MTRKKFLAATGSIMVIAGVTYYLQSDKGSLIRKDMKTGNAGSVPILPAEREMLYLASLAPSGHNTQPWFVKYIEPFHWVIGNDRTKWLPAVDPNQRETMLSIGAFLQNLEYAASNLQYNCEFQILATSNQDENIVDVKLNKSGKTPKYDTEKIKNRRTVRSSFLEEAFSNEDVVYLTNREKDFLHFIPRNAKEYIWLNEQTIEANKAQAYRDDAQTELASWIRFSSKDAQQYGNGLTTASMEIDGISGWIVRNFYEKADVMKKSFREQSIKKVINQVSGSAGWILITSKDNSVTSLLEAGKRMQRLFLNVREKNIAIHPMTQILEEFLINKSINLSTGISDNVQFMLRTGYIKNYPEPVSLRRPVDLFIRQ